MKKLAFTLGEVLVTLAIVGVIAAMVIPGVIQDMHNKANITLVKKVIGSLNLAVSTDAINHSSNIKDMDIYNDQKKFLETLDVVSVGKGANAPKKCGTSGSLTALAMDGKTNYTVGGSTSTVALLKNGVCVYFNTATPESKEAFDIKIGDANIYGVSIFSGELVTNKITNSAGFQEDIGDLHSDFIATDSLEAEKKKCYKGTTKTSCLNLLVESDWNPNYMKGYKPPKEGT